MKFPITLQWTGRTLHGLQVEFYSNTSDDSKVLYIPEDKDTCGLVEGNTYSGYDADHKDWRPIKGLKTYKIKE